MANAQPENPAADEKVGLTERFRGLFSTKGDDMGQKFLLRLTAFAVAIAVLILGAGVAFADPVTDTDITILGSESTNAYTNTLSVSVSMQPTHCPPSGDMDAIKLSFSNSSASGPWTVVKADGDAWPTGNCTGGQTKVPPAAATFDWDLASGNDGVRTVYARFEHGQDVSSSSDTVTLDTTAPEITSNGRDSGTAGSNGWYISAVMNGFSATDIGGSGIATVSCQTAWTISSGTNEGSSVTIPSGACSDVAGNTNTGISSSAYKIDLGNPLVEITSPTDESATADSSISVSGTASDATSGLSAVSVDGVAASLGTANSFTASGVALDCGANTVTATATDNAGRQTTYSIDVTRMCSSVNYSATFKQPIDGSALNIAKLGRVVPVKLEVVGSDDSRVETGAVTLHYIRTSCTGVPPTTDAVESYAGTANSGNEFRFDPEGRHWIYNLSTKGLVVNGCYSFMVKLDGAEIGSFSLSVTK